MRVLQVFLFSLLLHACTSEAGKDIRVESPWIAEIPPVIKVTAALMVVHNHGTEPAYLVAASSPRANSIEIHRSIVVNDLARMIEQKEVEIPAGGSVEFSNQTGFHLMFYGTDTITAGQRIPVSLEFRDGSVVTADYVVKDRRSKL